MEIFKSIARLALVLMCLCSIIGIITSWPLALKIVVAVLWVVVVTNLVITIVGWVRHGKE